MRKLRKALRGTILNIRSNNRQRICAYTLLPKSKRERLPEASGKRLTQSHPGIGVTTAER
ncbi:MAG: hypothetical protein M3120_03870 [Pseudomonadota bacterium]|nr:hypothetical protein [Pseudomonadota bacterium]